MTMNPKLEAIRAETTCAIDTLTPLDMHPDSILPTGPVLVQDGGSPYAELIFKHGRLGMRALHDTLAAATRAVRDISVPTNIATNQGGKVLRSKVPDEKKPALHAALVEALGRSVRTFQGNLTATEEGISKLNATIDHKLADPDSHKPSAASVASDIRRVLREYSSEQRIHAVNAAIREGDIEVARAVLGASPFASGLERKDLVLLRDIAEQQFAPRQHAQRAAGHQVLAQMMKAQKLFADRFGALLPKLEESKSDQSLARLRAGA